MLGQQLVVNEVTPPTYLSPSSMSTFKQCPQKFKFNKIDLIPDPSNHWAVLGNFVHDILEEMYKLPPELRTLENSRPIARQIWDEKWAEEALKVIGGFKITYKLQSFNEIEALKRFRFLAWQCVENLWDIEDPKKIEPTGLEYELNGEVSGVMLRGFIDRYSQTEGKMSLTVSDYKTGKTPTIDVDEKFLQLLIYAKLLSALGVGDVDKVELLYLKDKVRLEKKVTSDDLSRTVEYIQTTKSEIDKSCASGVFESRKSFLCNFCSYKKICPAWNGGLL